MYRETGVARQPKRPTINNKKRPVAPVAPGINPRGLIAGRAHSPAGRRHQLPLCLLPLDQLHLVLRSSLGEEVIHSGFPRDGGRGKRVVAGDHDSADAHGARQVTPFVASRSAGLASVASADLAASRFLIVRGTRAEPTQATSLPRRYALQRPTRQLQCTRCPHPTCADGSVGRRAAVRSAARPAGLAPG